MVADGIERILEAASGERSDEALRDSVEHAEAILESISDGLFIIDEEWRYTYVNRQGLSLSHMTHDQMIGQRQWDLFPEMIDTEMHRRFFRAMEEKQRDVFEYYYEPLDMWVEYRLYPIPGGLLDFVTDITPRKRAEAELASAYEKLEHRIAERTAELQESQQRLMLATEAAQIGIYDLDVDTGEATWDARVREMWEVGLEQQISTDIFLAGVHSEDRDRIQAEFERMFDPSGPRHFSVEYRVRGLRTGSERWVAAFGDMLFDGDRPRRLVGTIQDITPRKHAEQALARAFETEHSISNQLQAALLALPEAVPGVEFAHAYRSATDASRVGGDFYDVFELSHNHVGITIGDVAGKGLDAAVLTSLAKNTVRAHAAETGKSPAQVLALANEMLIKATATEAFVTLFFGMLDTRDGRLVYANAGHPTALVIRSDGGLSAMPVTGPILGAFSEADFEDVETRLALDDVMFLYTDGLTEARNDGEFYGEERLFEVADRVGAVSPSDLIEDLVCDVVSFTGGQLCDDLAILALRRREHEAEVPIQQKFEL